MSEVQKIMTQERNENEEMTIKELILNIQVWIRYFISKWIILMILIVIGAVTGYFYVYFSKPIYTAELTLALDDKSSGGGYSGIASQLGLDIGGSSGGAFSGDNNIELIRSRRLMEQTLLSKVKIDGKEQTLINRYIAFNELDKGWDEKPNLKNIVYLPGESRDSFSLEKDSVLYGVYRALKKDAVELNRIDKKLSIISLKVKSEDPYFAKFFAEHLIERASEFYIDTKTKKSRKNVELLEKRLDSVKTELSNEILGAAITRDQNANVLRAVGSVQSKKKEINVQVLGTMYGELTKNLEMAKFILMKEEPMIQIIDSPRFPLDFKKSGKFSSMFIGAFISGFIGVLYFTIVKLMRQLMA